MGFFKDDLNKKTSSQSVDKSFDKQLYSIFTAGNLSTGTYLPYLLLVPVHDNRLQKVKIRTKSMCPTFNLNCQLPVP